MATEITQSREMYLELSDDTGEYTRILRVPNPSNSYTNTTLAAISEIISPSFFPTATPGGTDVVPFFYDDYNPSKGLTKLKSAQVVLTRKEVTEIS